MSKFSLSTRQIFIHFESVFSADLAAKTFMIFWGFSIASNNNNVFFLTAQRKGHVGSFHDILQSNLRKQ